MRRRPNPTISVDLLTLQISKLSSATNCRSRTRQHLAHLRLYHLYTSHLPFRTRGLCLRRPQLVLLQRSSTTILLINAASKYHRSTILAWKLAILANDGGSKARLSTPKTQEMVLSSLFLLLVHEAGARPPLSLQVVGPCLQAPPLQLLAISCGTPLPNRLGP